MVTFPQTFEKSANVSKRAAVAQTGSLRHCRCYPEDKMMQCLFSYFYELTICIFLIVLTVAVSSAYRHDGTYSPGFFSKSTMTFIDVSR